MSGGASGTTAPTSDLPDLTIAEVAPLLRSGELKATDLTRAVLDRVSELDPFLNSYITLTADAAMADADQADAEIAAGRHRGHLHGVPIAHKDVFLTKGVRTTAHSRVLEDHVPQRDATVVTRLDDAGATDLGKLNTYEFACGATPVFGLPINPWSSEHITGGSSAGSASAVAAGLAMGATGTDTAGSIRVPSSFCGIVGLKPTYGLVSRAGLLPVSWSLDHVGPMAKSVLDAAILLDALAGFDPLDPGSARAARHGYADALMGADGTRSARDGLQGLRLGVPRGFLDAPVQPDVVERVTEAYDALRDLGAELLEVDLPSSALTASALRAIMWPEATDAHLHHLRAGPDRYDPATRRTVSIGAALRATDYLRGQRLRRAVTEELLEVLERVDALVWPGAMRTAFGVREPQAWSGQQTRLSNLTGTPSLVVPCGFSSEGLPIAIQLNGRHFSEHLLFRIAAAFESATGHTSARPRPAHRQPPAPKDQFAAPPPADADAAERSALQDEVSRGFARHGIPLIEADLPLLVDELFWFRHDLEAAERTLERGLEPAVLQVPVDLAV